MATLTMTVDDSGRCRPATSADRRTLRRKLATAAGVPYRGLAARVDYLVSLCAATRTRLVFEPSPSPATSSPLRRRGA